MPVNLFTSAGQPLDTIGTDGDMNWDKTNRIFWGPRGASTAGSWSGTANSIQGAAGLGQISGVGAPSNSIGQNGQGYVDYASGNSYVKNSSGVWAQAGNFLGPQGNTGQTLMTSLATSPGPNGAFNNVTLSSTPYVVPYPGSSVPSQFSPPSSSAFMGVYAYASAACTLSLYNVTTSTTVWSVSIAANQTIGNQNFSATQWPLTAGNVYQWQVTGSSSCYLVLLPFYLMPANTNAPAIGMAGPAGFAANQTFSSTAVKLPSFGSAAGANTWGYAPPRTGGLYSAQATFTPASGTPASASVQLALNYALMSNGSGGVNSLTISPVTANGLPQTILAPRLSDQSSTFTTGYFFYWTATGSGTGTLLVNLLPIV